MEGGVVRTPPACARLSCGPWRRGKFLSFGDRNGTSAKHGIDSKCVWISLWLQETFLCRGHIQKVVALPALRSLTS